MKIKPDPDKPDPEWNPAVTPTFWINHASRVVMKHFEHRLRPLNFGMAYLPVAIALDENGSLPQKQLAAIAGVEQPTMASLLMRMERDGLIVRTANASDRRSSLYALSGEAKERLPAVKQCLSEVVSQALKGILPDDRTRLMGTLAVIIENLEKG